MFFFLSYLTKENNENKFIEFFFHIHSVFAVGNDESSSQLL
jgi:hypothetical protein